MTFGHLSYVASYKHPAARKSAAGAAISWRVRPSVIGVEYALIVVCRGSPPSECSNSAQKAIRARTVALGEEVREFICS